MELDMEKMFREYLKEDCICMGYFSSSESFMNNLYVHFGITKEDIERELYSVYIEDGLYYMTKLDLRKAIQLKVV